MPNPDFAPNMATNPEKPIGKPYFHSSVPEHLADLADQAKNPQEPKEGDGEKAMSTQGVVFDRKHVDLFNQALQDPSHEHRRAAERAMRGFARAVEKPQGISISSAASEFNVPLNFFWRWAKKRQVIPILVEGKGSGSATLIHKGKAQEVAELYHEAKRQGKQPKTLIEKKYPDSSRHPQNRRA